MPAKKKSKASSSKSKAKSKKVQSTKKQIWAIILFALGIFIFFLTLINGTNLWGFLRSVLFGCFSFGAYALAPMIIYTAIILTLEKPEVSITAKLIEGFLILTFVCSLIHILIGGADYVSAQGENIFIKLAKLYESSVNFKSGGLISALIAWPLCALFDKVGS
ncbi:MAG: hypothetical protein RR483_02680, partial [Clostridia bacterium]